MGKKAWLLYSIEYCTEQHEIGIVLGDEDEARKKASILFNEKVEARYQSDGGDAAVVEDWRDKLISLGMSEDDLDGKKPPRSEFEGAMRKARAECSHVSFRELPIL